MTGDMDYLPGCYRNLVRMPDEGLAGYLLRVAEGNGYSGIAPMLRAINRSARRPIADVLLDIRLDRDALSDIGRMTAGDSRHLLGLLAEALPPLPDPTEAIFFDECRIDRDALVLGISPICPMCLACDEFATAEWELAPVTICARHQSLLRDSCERCSSPLTWRRPALNYCGRCGADLRPQSTSAVTDAAVLAVNEDFRALAPFRLIDSQGQLRTVFLDEMFRVFKALLLTDAQWALGQWPRILASSSTVPVRYQAVVELSRCKVGNAYDLSRLRWKADRALSALEAVPWAFIKEKTARRFLEAEVGLSRESADEICGADAIPMEPSAYEVIRPWPPELANRGEVSRFLGVPLETVDTLIRNGWLVPPVANQDGFDADGVLAAGRFLNNLIDLPRLSGVAGIPADAGSLAAYGLLPRWNGPDQTDHRVDPLRVLEIQQLLLVQWHRAKAPTRPVSLGQLVQDHEQPFRALIEIVRKILSGQIDRLGWRPPFKWSDLEIEAD
jgi:hypothetical protein